MIKEIDKQTCVGCGICALVCPADVIEMNEKQEKAEIKYPKDCWTCYSCEMACPVKAIYVHHFRKVKPMAW